MPEAIESIDTAGSFGTLMHTRYAPASTQAAAEPPAEATNDTADVANTLALLAAIAKAAGAVPAVDEARVAAVQQRIAAGTLRADPLRIARSYTELEALLA